MIGNGNEPLPAIAAVNNAAALTYPLCPRRAALGNAEKVIRRAGTGDTRGQKGGFMRCKTQKIAVKQHINVIAGILRTLGGQLCPLLCFREKNLNRVHLLLLWRLSVPLFLPRRPKIASRLHIITRYRISRRL